MRIAIGVEYSGARYHGWQRQRSQDSIQERLEKALSIVANKPIRLVCAGRTDTGVHAQGQVAHFDTDVDRSDRGWLLGANSNLADDISVMWVQRVTTEFHARFKASARLYRYIILNRLSRPAILQQAVCWHYQSLSVSKMLEASRYLIGKHDFNSYRAVGCQSKSAIRVVEFIKINRSGDFIYIDIKANAFLHHMVRNIVGVLLVIGRGEQQTDWSKQVLEACDRTKAGMTAPAQGLYFVAAYYPKIFGLPSVPVPIEFSA